MDPESEAELDRHYRDLIAFTPRPSDEQLRTLLRQHAQGLNKPWTRPTPDQFDEFLRARGITTS